MGNNVHTLCGYIYVCISIFNLYVNNIISEGIPETELKEFLTKGSFSAQQCSQSTCCDWNLHP